MNVEHSRSLRLAEGASRKSRPALERSLEGSTVCVSLDPELPYAGLTARVLVSTLRRGPGRLVIVSDDIPSSLLTDLEQAALAIDPDRGVTITHGCDIDTMSAAVHIGPTAPRGAIRIVPEGYGAHVATSSGAVIRPGRQANPLGAIFAASLGAAEVFKHTADVMIRRRVKHRHLRWCPVSLGPRLDVVPDFHGLVTDLTLVGVGAIGTGIVLLLKELGIEGSLVAIDVQKFAKENLGTYSLGTDSDAASGIWKVDIAKRELPRFNVTPISRPVNEVVAAVDAGQVAWTSIVLTAVDSPEARRESQRLWPDRLIDGQTGDTMLGMCDHRHSADPCLICLFGVRRDEPSGASAVANRLGLTPEELADAEAILTEDYLVGKSECQVNLLRPHLGKPICGLAQATGLSNLGTNDYMPSVPFISLQSACLVVGRLIAAVHGFAPSCNFVQYDGLIGPQAATTEAMVQRSDCQCQTRASVIDEVRRRRRGRP